MTIPEVLDAFYNYTTPENIPLYFIDLERLCLVGASSVRQVYQATIASIGEADIERHTSYANQRREDVIRMIVKGVVKYAVLSHTWSTMEFLYRDLVSDSPRTGPGWHKLEHFCRIARDSFRCRFAWADMVCIDHSSVEGPEFAAQFLFNWYRNAHVCITYLAEAHDPSDMGRGRWFRSGFTLTELLAPTRIKFYGADWKALNNDDIENDKADEGFLESLSGASGIPIDDLRIFWPGPERIREKLSWASRRTTSLVEDAAYSLMALFDSRISVRYGEGEMAFTRLMVDLVPKSGECDVFAWAGPCSDAHPGIPRSLAGFGKQRRDRELNPDPHHYRLCGDRSVSIGPDCLCIRVLLLDVTLQWFRGATYQPVVFQHAATVSDVAVLNPQDVATRLEVAARVAVGIIDYGWTDSPDEGILRNGDQYFCFLLCKCTDPDGRWRKLLTEKVVFLTNGKDLVQGLETLDIRHDG